MLPSGAPTSPPKRSWPSSKVASGALLSLLVAWTLLGNASVCAAVASSRRLRCRRTHLFVASLAASDLLVAVLVMPWKAASEVSGRWPFGAAFCRFWVASDILCSTASILNLCLISLDRYWAIAKPFGYQRRMTSKVALGMVALAWGVASVVSFLPVQLGWHMPSPSLNGSLDDKEKEAEEEEGRRCDASLSRTYAVASSLVSFYIPVAIMVVTYTKIYRIARLQIRRISSLERAALQRRRRPPPSTIRKEAKVLKTLSLLMGVFVCCWLPFFVLNCLLPFCPATEPPCVSRDTFDAFVWVGWANSALNPFIYASDAEFRKVFAGLLRGPRRRRRRESDATPAESANAGRRHLRQHLAGREGELSLDIGSHVPPSREIATSSLL